MVKLSTITGAAALVLAGLAPQGAAQAQDTVRLKLSTYIPGGHRLVKEFIEPWMKQVKDGSGGKVEFTLYTAGSAFGNIVKTRYAPGWSTCPSA